MGCKLSLVQLVLMWLPFFLFSSQVFCDKNQTVVTEGATLKFTKLAETMQVIAEKGAEVFYSGSVAQDLIKDVQEAGLVVVRCSFMFREQSLNSVR